MQADKALILGPDALRHCLQLLNFPVQEVHLVSTYLVGEVAAYGLHMMSKDIFEEATKCFTSKLEEQRAKLRDAAGWALQNCGHRVTMFTASQKVTLRPSQTGSCSLSTCLTCANVHQNSVAVSTDPAYMPPQQKLLFWCHPTPQMTAKGCGMMQVTSL